MDRGMDDGARRHGWSPWNYCDYCGEKGEDRGDRLLSSNGIPGTRTKSSQLRGWGVARPSPRWDSTLRLYIYIFVCVCVYTGRHGRLVPWEEIFGIARTF